MDDCKYLVLLSAAILLSFSLSAQEESPEIAWENNFGGSRDDKASDIEKTDDGGFVVAGYANLNSKDVGKVSGLWLMNIEGYQNPPAQPGDGLEWIIFNQWGEQVFKTTEKPYKWDSAVNGDKADPGSYYYIFTTPNWEAKGEIRVNDKIKYGVTALMAASSNGHLKVVKYLVENGAKINFKNNKGETALTLAKSNGYNEIVSYLQKVKKQKNKTANQDQKQNSEVQENVNNEKNKKSSHSNNTKAAKQSKDKTYNTIDIEKNIPKTQSQQANTYALIIGNENYTKYQSSLSRESNVDFAKRDARVFAKYCRKTLGIPKENIKLDLNVTAAKMKRQIKWLVTRAQYSTDSVKLIFYFSGHGFPNQETREKYLMPVDVTGSQVTQGIQLGKLYDQLNQHKTKRVTVFLDACFSGAGREKGFLAAKSVKIEPKENAIINGRLVAFSSSSNEGDQRSLFYKEQKHGLFTYYLLKKLKETEGEVTYGALYDYLSNKVPFKSTAIKGLEQVPGVRFSEGVKDNWREWQLR